MVNFAPILWKIFYESEEKTIYPLPTDGRVSFLSEIKMPATYWSAIGYHCLDNFAVRIDVFERIFYLARQKITIETPKKTMTETKILLKKY